ncbi:MAG TPA: acetate/propionate family kinase [Solirubrobacteraceae bacterium]|nr:acetate/propionate family kinase [Solirubrobacteraceae bacterium]
MARVLVVNAGSSTIKLSLVEDEDQTIWSSELAASEARVNADALGAAIDQVADQVDAVGHRIVHGGERFTSAVRIDDAVERELRALSELAPLHQPKSLAALDAVAAALPAAPAYACFDTAFHADLPAAARTYALPAAWRKRWPIRRYGFHGLSHAWVARRAPELLGLAAADLRIVSCHLGAGASLCAIADGRSQATTMGFTPLEGLVMATRSGDVDPGLLLWLLERGDMSAGEAGHALEHESGLRGLAGSADMREVLERAGTDADAKLALEVYLHRLSAGIAAMAAALGGLDALVFTGGVGQRAPAVRAAAAERLGFLGTQIDPALNAAGEDDRELSAAGAAVRTLVVAAREDLEIARQVRQVLGTLSSPPKSEG